MLSSGLITLNATNGAPGGTLIVLASTNVALPLNAWTPIQTNAFDGAGDFTGTITVNPALSAQFYILKAR